MRPKQQGFDESDQQRLASKLQQKNNQNDQLGNTFFVMPEAKPLLSKQNIDMSKPKVLIKQIQIALQPPELLSSNLHKDIFSIDRPHNSKIVPQKYSNLLTIWEKFIISQSYTIIYLKYYKEDLVQLHKKSFKKFKLELQKLCRNQNYLFSTYIIDLSFLNDAGSYLLRNLKPTSFQQILQGPFEDNIQFDSKFQNGNLFAVFQKKGSASNILQFDLILQSDINSKGYSNWFYFRIRNKKKATIKFNIVNMQKNHSLYSQGMKAVFYSYNRHQKEHIEWHRDGYGYSYYKNELLKTSQNQSTYSTLSFSYDIKYDNDLVYVAANMPYSYSKLTRYIESIEKIAKLNSNIYFKKQSVASSISSNSCPVITLTWKRQKRKDQKKKKKKIIGVIARQHPCETVSSYVMEGFINSLVYLNSQSAVSLLQNYIFKIVPMVNVDGVIYGNSRCDICGNDINRRWSKNPNKFIYPIVSGIKTLFQKLIQQQYEIEYFIDLHGHSRKMGSFIYGCKTFDQFQSRQTAWILSRINSKVIFQQCQFGLSPFKKETARGVMCDLVAAKKSLTLQTSFYGYRTISSKHWEIKDLQKIGSSLIQALYAQTSRDPKLFNWQTLKNEVKQAVESLSSNNKLAKSKQDSDSSFGSDSNPSQDEMTSKQKAEYFLDPTLASKIGLNQIRIIKKQKIKNTEQKNLDSQAKLENSNKYEMIIDGFKQKVQFVGTQKSQMLIQSKQFEEELKQKDDKQKNFIVRQARSTTKILPFKFTERSQKRSLQKHNRRSVQLLIKRPQKLSVPDLPRVESKGNFWSNLKKQYEVLLFERKRKDQV